MRLPRRVVGAVAAAVSAASAVTVPASSGASDAVAGNERVPSPKVTGPVSGQPASLSAVDLAAHGYVEEEFFLEGTARAYEPTGPLPADGRWSVKESSTAPYRTRVLVRRPKDPSKFKGVVQVEWLNVSGGLDAAPDWGLGHAELLRGGFAWAGVSAQAIGVKNLQNSRADRYATLVHPGDAYSYDIYSQAGAALRRPSDTSLLGRKFRIKRLIADGESQSAFRMVTYINAIQPLTRIFDGFFVHSRFANGSPLSEDTAGAIPSPTFIRTDGKAPILVLEAETDVPRHLAARQPDRARYRLWEVAGTAHFDEDGLHALTGIPKEDMVQTPPLGCAQRLNSAPMRYVVAAGMHHLARWASGARPPPRAPRVEVSGGEMPTIVRDEFGNARGGIRLPQLEVPTATLSGDSGGGPGFCFLFGFTAPFDAGRLGSLYPTQREYIAKFEQATDRAVRQGFILAADAKEAKQGASGSGTGG
jgi:Alpha/beta hydrolase domain